MTSRPNRSSIHRMLRAALALLTFSVAPVFALGGTPAFCKGDCLASLKKEDKIQVVFLTDSFANATCTNPHWIDRVRLISKVEPVGTADCPYGLRRPLNLFDPPAVVATESRDSLVLRPDIDFANWTMAFPKNAVDSLWYKRPAISSSKLKLTLGAVFLVYVVGVFAYLFTQPATNHM